MSKTALDDRLRALAAKYYVEPGDGNDDDPEPDMTFAHAAAAIGAAEAYEDAAGLFCECRPVDLLNRDSHSHDCDTWPFDIIHARAAEKVGK